MFNDTFKIKHWHYEIIDGHRKRIIDEVMRPKVKGQKMKSRRPCAICGKPTIYIICSVKCINAATPEQWRAADRAGLTIQRASTSQHHDRSSHQGK